MVITKTETKVDNEGNIIPLRVYHRAGTIEGRKDEKYVWTHKMEEVETCLACTSGTIPPEVRSAKP